MNSIDKVIERLEEQAKYYKENFQPGMEGAQHAHGRAVGFEIAAKIIREECADLLGKPLGVTHNRGKGKVTINLDNLDEIEDAEDENER